MIDEEMRKTMRFILEHQAQFSVDIQKLQEGHLRIQEVQQKVEENHLKLQESQQKLNESQLETAQLVNRLPAVTLKGFKETDERINALIESQMRTEEQQRKTDEKIGKLTDVVERHLREEHGGKEGRNGDST